MTETVSGASDLDDDVFSPSAIRDPYTYYGRIRETDPVRWNERHRVWVVTRFNDVARINRRRYLVTSSPGQIGEP